MKTCCKIISGLILFAQGLPPDLILYVNFVAKGASKKTTSFISSLYTTSSTKFDNHQRTNNKKRI